jgi:hypothetical protein
MLSRLGFIALGLVFAAATPSLACPSPEVHISLNETETLAMVAADLSAAAASAVSSVAHVETLSTSIEAELAADAHREAPELVNSDQTTGSISSVSPIASEARSAEINGDLGMLIPQPTGTRSNEAVAGSTETAGLTPTGDDEREPEERLSTMEPVGCEWP